MKLFWFALLLFYQGQSMAQSWPGFATQQSCLTLYPDYQHLVQSTIQYLHTQPQHADFLSVWRETSQRTEFTRFDFPISTS